MKTLFFLALLIAAALCDHNMSHHTHGTDMDCSTMPPCQLTCPPTVPVPLGQADMYVECDPAVNPQGTICGNRCIYSDCDDKGVAPEKVANAACECHQMMDGRWHWMCLHARCECPPADSVEQHSICPMNAMNMMNSSFVGAYRVDSGTRGCKIDGQKSGCACSTAHDADDMTDNWHWHCSDDRIQPCGDVQGYSLRTNSAGHLRVGILVVLATWAALGW